MRPEEQLRRYTQEVEQVIDSFLPEETGHQKTVIEAMNYSMRAGGKRLRPLFMREVYRLFGGTTREIEPFMAAIEMIHTFSLVHDDLPCMDHDEFRRGLPTTWVKYGTDMAVLAGDALFIYALETAARAFDMTDQKAAVARCIQILTSKSGIAGMIGGQTVDVELTGKPLDGERLDFIYRLKTGALLEAPMMIGALLAGAGDAQIKTVEEMAAAVGMAFQIQDDILDVAGSQEVLGKPAGSDEKNCKTTYVTLYGMDRARAEVAQYSQKAAQCLSTLPGNHEFLESLIEMLVTREK